MKQTGAFDAYFKTFPDLGASIKRIEASLLWQQEQMKAFTVPPLLQIGQVFQTDLITRIGVLDLRSRLCESVAGYENIVSPILNQIGDAVNLLTSSMGRIFEDMRKRFDELPPKTQEALILLGKRGWYLDLAMSLPELWDLREALIEKNVAAAEEALIDYYEARVNEIETSIVRRFPERKRMFNAAFNAHRRQEYELSIPVLLAQTDGICKEVVDKYLFRRRDKKPEIAAYVEQFAADTFRTALLSPLAHNLPIGASSNERGETFTELNRHTVMHGESLDYGTKINSLKAVSLINYVAHVLRADDDKHSHHGE